MRRIRAAGKIPYKIAGCCRKGFAFGIYAGGRAIEVYLRLCPVYSNALAVVALCAVGIDQNFCAGAGPRNIVAIAFYDVDLG